MVVTVNTPCGHCPVAPSVEGPEFVSSITGIPERENGIRRSLAGPWLRWGACERRYWLYEVRPASSNRLSQSLSFLLTAIVLVLPVPNSCMRDFATSVLQLAGRSIQPVERHRTGYSCAPKSDPRVSPSAERGLRYCGFAAGPSAALRGRPFLGRESAFRVSGTGFECGMNSAAVWSSESRPKHGQSICVARPPIPSPNCTAGAVVSM